MSLKYFSVLVILLVFEASSSKTLYSEEDYGDLDLLKDNDLTISNDKASLATCPDPKPLDCADLYKQGNKFSGLYTIYPNHRIIPCGKLTVYCDMTTDGGGWTVIQRRGDFKRPNDYFFKTWDQYKKGFGNLKEDFWLGNDNIYILSNQKKNSIRFDLASVKDEKAYAQYDEFWIENEDLKYRLHIDGYSGTAGDSMLYHDNMYFSTKDRKNDNSTGVACALSFQGGWWYNSCVQSHLNGIHYKGSYEGEKAKGVIWKTFKGLNDSLATVQMKIRPADFTVYSFNS